MTAPRLTPTFLGMPPFPRAAREALADTQLRANLARATATIRTKRARAVSELGDWENLRAAGAAIKDDVLTRLPEYLQQLESAVLAAGGQVHWARDAAEANRIVVGLVAGYGSGEVVKVKSMATQEIELNEALARAGIHVWETDLAELIVQLGHDLPSHILVPAIHRNRAEIRDIFRAEMGTVGRPAPDELTDNPADLAEAARLHLREKFLRAKVAISGGNFAVAETGTVVVLESEGNGRMCLTLPEALISVVGIEKLVPTWADLEVFLQLLPRSSTAERMNPYTSMWTGVTPGDGPQRFHLVLLDSGRTATLADPVGRQALRCIRCSACLNVCPVYERTGGKAYGSAYPGPIGAIITPQLRGINQHPVDAQTASLPYASSLCGACFEVCPVRINIPEVLVHLRAKVVDHKRHRPPSGERLAMAGVRWVFARPGRLSAAQRTGGLAGRLLGRDGRLRRLPGPGWISAWFGSRDLSAPPREAFRTWWRRTHRAGHGAVSGDGGTGPGGGAGHGGRGPDPGGRDAGRRGRRPDPGPGTGSGEARGPEAVGGALTEARAEILRRIGRALADGPHPPAVPREYQRHAAPDTDLVALFAERAADYKSTVERTSEEALPGAIAAALATHRVRELVVPAGVPAHWLRVADVTRHDDDPPLTVRQLDALHGVLTGCAVAIAETGTIVLDAGAAQGRRALTLLPDVHVCVVRAEQIAGTVAEALQRLDARHPLTWISGPSATSDIELDRVEGVHGPRSLHILVTG